MPYEVGDVITPGDNPTLRIDQLTLALEEPPKVDSQVVVVILGVIGLVGDKTHGLVLPTKVMYDVAGDHFEHTPWYAEEIEEATSEDES